MNRVDLPAGVGNAIYHSAEMKPYRKWLNSYFLETIGSLGGSLVSDDITDYYVDPIELGYGRMIGFDRDRKSVV